MAKTRGRVTLPSEAGFLNETKEMLVRWGADALRDSDGTKLDPEIKKLFQDAANSAMKNKQDLMKFL